MKYKIIQEDNKNYLIRNEIYKRHCDEMEHILQLNRETVHNMKNHLWVMKKMGEEKDINRLKNYIDVLCQEIREVDNQTWTGNRVLDMVLSQKKVTAEQKGIGFEIYAMLLPDLRISDVEICALFGNLLDNSIEACEKTQITKRNIRVKIEMKEGLLFVKIENGIGKVPIVENGELISTKKDKSIHGYGMKSVYRIVNKYSGSITYQASDKRFWIVVTFFDMLDNTKRKEEITWK